MGVTVGKQAHHTSGMRGVMIRQAVEDDAEAIAAVCTRAASRAYAGLVTDEYVARVVAHFHAPARVRREVAPAEGWFGFAVAECDQQVVGAAGTGRSAHDASACELYTLHVDPPHQREGVGRALVAHSVAQARVAGARHLDVAVMPGNMGAIRFYQACGFVAAGDRPIYAPHGEEGGPAVALVFMRRL